jgi:hypothetical protein
VIATTFAIREGKRKIYCSESSQALLARPSDQGRRETRQSVGRCRRQGGGKWNVRVWGHAAEKRAWCCVSSCKCCCELSVISSCKCYRKISVISSCKCCTAICDIFM